jgi:Leucine-rich repeat (LRR) protein
MPSPCRRTAAVFVLLVLVAPVLAQAAVSASERSALVALYNATGGARWKSRTGWLGSPGTECSWFGVVCNAQGTAVQEIYLSDNGLAGTLPAALGNLSNLRVLELEGNGLTGAVPKDLGRLGNLRSLRMGLNQLSGALPKELGSLSRLETLALPFNRLSGGVPSELERLTALRILDLSGNDLSGSIPVQTGQLLGLQYLDLSGNRLSGGIPVELGNLSVLEALYLGDNQLSGPIPRALGNLTALLQLSLGDNQLSGGIPPELGNLASLLFLDLRRNQLSGVIPPELGNATSLLGLLLSSNRLGGTIPSALGNLLGLTTLWLDGNLLTGPIPLDLWGLVELTDGGGLDLRGNALSTDIDPDFRSFLDSKQVGGNWIDFQTEGSVCVPGANTLCLSGGRFRVQVGWRRPDGQTGPGRAVALTGDTGYFWFFNESNVEMVIKVLDACGLNGRFWVFAGGLTDVQTDITVTDTATGDVQTYRNPQGTAFQPIQDTAAFATCDAQASVAAAVLEIGSTSLDLNGGRFRVEVDWRRPDGQSGPGQGVALTGDTGYFWFFSQSNVEMVIKVLDACGLNQKLWVFAGGLTDVRTEIRVTDTRTGAVKTYVNPQGAAFRPIQDTGAFGTCE